MGTIKGGSLSVDSATKAKIEQEVLNGAGDFVLRLKSTKDGTIQALVDKGANGNLFSRNLNKATLQKKSDNNQAVAMLWLQRYASEGATGAQLSQDSIDTALSERLVVTVEEARRLLDRGSNIDKARSAPHNNLGEIAGNIALYIKSGDAGGRVLKEHLNALDISNSRDPGTLRQLSQMLASPELNVSEQLRNVVSLTWQEAGRNLVRDGDKASLAMLLANADNLDDVASLKASLQGEARDNKKTFSLSSYNQIVNRTAELTGIQEAKRLINQGESVRSGQRILETSLRDIKLSNRKEYNKTLQQVALKSAMDYLKSNQPVMPDTKKLADFYAQKVPVSDLKGFQKQFANGLQDMVEAGDLSVDDVKKMNDNLGMYEDPKIYRKQQLEDLAIALTIPPRTASRTPPSPPGPLKRPIPKTAPATLKRAVPRNMASELSSSGIVQNNKQRFDQLRSLTKQRLETTQYVKLSDQRFKGIKSPQQTNVPVASPRAQSSVPQQGMIHANYVPLAKKTAIATQYPAENTQSRGTFWRMAVQQGTQMVVDLTQTTERLAPYYPDQQGVPIEYDGMQVTLLNSKDNTHTYKVSDTSTGESHTIQRYHYKNWEDHKSAAVDDLKAMATMLNRDDLESVAVHCRAGVGRTCTVFSAAVLQNKVSSGELTAANKDQVIDEVILDMRIARGEMAVQTAAQRMLLSDLVDDMLA